MNLTLLAKSVLLLIIAFPPAIAAQNWDWKPVSPAELGMTTPKVEPDADAEMILWEVLISDEKIGLEYQTVLYHYQKIKIFNERGREAFSKRQIGYGRIPGIGLNIRIRDISARATRTDGSVFLLKDSEVFEQDTLNREGVKLKTKSFVTPGIDAGAVVEYRWKEIRGVVSNYQRLNFAGEIPIQLVRYFIRPLDRPYLQMMGQPFNIESTPFRREGSGYYSTTASNVPAFKPEPRMAPEYAIRPWMLLYYTDGRKLEPEKFWKEHGKDVYSNYKDRLDQSDEIIRAAREAVGSETDASKKLLNLFRYAQTKVKDVFDDRYNTPEDELSKYKPNRNAAEALKRGIGTADDINHLFTAMAIAAGFDARIVNLPRRSDIFFHKDLTNRFFMRTENVAVRIGDSWRFFDPGSIYVPYGMLRWEEEGQPALVSDNKEPVWATSPLSPADKSAEIRRGYFKLAEDGVLEGIVSIEYTGHLAEFHKELNDEDGDKQREDTLRNLVKSRILDTAEISEVLIENVTDPSKPFRYQFKLRVPNYAAKTGRRLFMQPNVFERGSPPLFASSTRKHEVYFSFPYSETDEVSIELPPGYELESPDAPTGVNDGVGSNNISISMTKDGKTLYYKRKFTFGDGDALRFEARNYVPLKALFDAIHNANRHTLTLQPK